MKTMAAQVDFCMFRRLKIATFVLVKVFAYSPKGTFKNCMLSREQMGPDQKFGIKD